MNGKSHENHFKQKILTKYYGNICIRTCREVNSKTLILCPHDWFVAFSVFFFKFNLLSQLICYCERHLYFPMRSKCRKKIKYFGCVSTFSPISTPTFFTNLISIYRKNYALYFFHPRITVLSNIAPNMVLLLL